MMEHEASDYQMSEELKSAIKIDYHLRRFLNDTQFENGVRAFSQLIDISDDSSRFNIDYGEILNANADDLNNAWIDISGNRIEDLLGKLRNLTGESTPGEKLRELYTHIGFDEWINDERIRRIWQSEGEVFDIETADASIYRNSPFHFRDYIISYQSAGPAIRELPYDVEEVITSVFVVYIDQCYKNAELIEKKHKDEILIKKIDYVGYANDHMKDMEDFDKQFLQLSWSDDNTSEFEYDYEQCVKFIGEPGTGKTTQMRKMYYRALENVKKGEMMALPVWIELSRLDLDSSGIKEVIRNALGEYKEYYDDLVENNIIMLFLDGYNEVLLKRSNDYLRRNLAIDIDSIRRDHTHLFIAMTDRARISNPRCMTQNVRVFTFQGFTDCEMENYVRLKTTEDETKLREQVMSFLTDGASRWFFDSNPIPEKMDQLIIYMRREGAPDSLDSFYDKYFDAILEREDEEKHEMRTKQLKRLLSLLTEEMAGYNDEIHENRIINIWISDGEVTPDENAYELFKIATELEILIRTGNEDNYKFKYPQYYHKMHAYRGL